MATGILFLSPLVWACGANAYPLFETLNGAPHRFQNRTLSLLFAMTVKFKQSEGGTLACFNDETISPVLQNAF